MKIFGKFFKFLNNNARVFGIAFCVSLVVLSFSDVIFAQQKSTKVRAASKRINRKVPASTNSNNDDIERAGAIKVNRSGSVNNTSSESNEQVKAEKDAAALALEEALSFREIYNKEITQLKLDLDELEAEVKSGKNLKCDFEGSKITVAQYQSKINTDQSMIDTDKDYQNAITALSEKEKELASLQASVEKKEAELKKMVGGTVATSALAVGGAGALGMTAADLIKTKMTAGELQKGNKVCEKYGFFGR